MGFAILILIPAVINDGPSPPTPKNNLNKNNSLEEEAVTKVAEAGQKAKENAEAEQKAKEDAEAEQKAKENAEAEQKAKEDAEAKQKAKEEAEAEQKAKEEAEAEQKAKEEAEAEPVRLSSSFLADSTFRDIKYNSEAKMKIGGIKYEYGVQLYAKSEETSKDDYVADFDLGGKYSRLTGRIGLDDEENNTGDATIYFFNETDALLYKNTAEKTKMFNVNIDVNGVNKLRITSKPTTVPKYIDLIDMELLPS